MISVENLTKEYAGFRAVQGISFAVQQGEIVGFLGPNGAGKTTTMRILAGYLPPTGGTVAVAGHDIVAESLEARRHVGYMPENVPLYTDLRVNEYLAYRARLKGVKGKKVGERVEAVNRLCHLEDVKNKIIGNLSKGYRQRVGLADALVHEPDLLILDEPTIGLDPHQIRAVRDLIRSLGERHTILLSSHILSEVEAVCTRVLILHRGRIEASDTAENLARLVRGGGLGAIRVEVSCPSEEARREFSRLAEVETVHCREEREGWSILEIASKGGKDLRDEIFSVVQRQNWRLREMSRVRASLEDIFVELTQD
ncbi:ABC transporter ATP-binding protein [Methylacidimicrobium sp. B4]|uniref:ABC transporter ATP-binding protein n=1 Tax=Methylacidimicrobium sp. B4 TaxID=2796139 RepID=UPI001A8FD95D|nr:ABC transporter ATP-binding protein [Methylacidimicrobium sp. B4]QSR85879.1 ATP-binding cassette domain-containing protein [Methylacidimicrobium sp. B4]